jgi:hypothetical protein
MINMEKQVTTKLSREEARLQVIQALSSLTTLQEALGKKKFGRRIRKAEKILSTGLKKQKKQKVKKVDIESAA